MHNRRHYASFASVGLLAAFGVRLSHTTLDEEEHQSVLRMKRRAARRRQIEEARIAAEVEAARPKSRQERRALAREAAKDPRRWDHRKKRYEP